MWHNNAIPDPNVTVNVSQNIYMVMKGTYPIYLYILHSLLNTLSVHNVFKIIYFIVLIDYFTLSYKLF